MFCAGDGSLPNSAAIFSIFFCVHSVLHTKISSENSCICQSVCSAQQASRQVGKQKIRRTGRGAWGADFILRPFAATKSASKSPSMRCCVVCCLSCFLRQFFHNPAAALFFADFSQRRNPLRFGKSVYCSERSLRCGKSLRPGCVVYLTVRIALRDRSV